MTQEVSVRHFFHLTKDCESKAPRYHIYSIDQLPDIIKKYMGGIKGNKKKKKTIFKFSTHLIYFF